jgi:T3SS negative regulator,GrlR
MGGDAAVGAGQCPSDTVKLRNAVHRSCGETIQRAPVNSGLPRSAGNDDDARAGDEGAMTVTNGLYSIYTEMTEGGRGHATGIIVLRDGKIAGGDSHFYYTGTYTADAGKWRGELTTYEHAKAVGALPLFGGREVTCGFTGTYSADGADVNGTALVGKTSVLFQAKLTLRSAM